MDLSLGLKIFAMGWILRQAGINLTYWVTHWVGDWRFMPVFIDLIFGRESWWWVRTQDWVQMRRKTNNLQGIAIGQTD